MKISASIYSNKRKELKDIVAELDAHGTDFFHIDCNDDPGVFDDIAEIRKLSTTPIDLHIITSDPTRYYDLIAAQPVDAVCFQYEPLQQELNIPANINARVGLAISSNTDIDVFAPYAQQLDFILIMATTPGQSGGTFDKHNFRKIRQFRQRFPKTRIHVDGGVNHEVSFILRNMGVYAAVSGSYLMNSDSIGAAMLNLKTHDVGSHYLVGDFMRQLDETPILRPHELSVRNILQSIEDHKLGFTLLVDKQGALQGMITNADVRKGMLKHVDNLNALEVADMINPSPAVARDDFTVQELISYIQEQSFPVNYLPVVNSKHEVTGSVTFFNLVKGEV
ncbi:CBS domain-containing protein [Thiohalophilus sp.]|uniref:CBS domain-containing protein n=1 Tax=Thiohalophilus sp. TaxID=3028392 RepID=UPI003974A58C